MEQAFAVTGIIVFVFLAWGFSTDRRAFPWRIVLSGMLLQFLVAWAILKTSLGERLFSTANDVITAMISQSDAGAKFLFGDNFTEHFFAFKVLSTIIFFSSLSSLLFHWGFLQKVVAFFALTIRRVMGISGAESLAAAGNIFLGQTEAPLLIRPYIRGMTQSEIMSLMTGGMATIAGGVMAAYVGMGVSAGHLFAASVMSAPAAILFAKVMVPEKERSLTMGGASISVPSEAQNSFDAICQGASEGVKLALNVAGMLIATIAIIALFNLLLGYLTSWMETPLTLEFLLSYLFSPFAVLMGVPMEESLRIGRLLGERTVFNEFVAYAHLSESLKTEALSERATVIATYALCGFANFSSIAIQIGGIGNLVPEKKQDFARFGLRAMVAGTLASFVTAAIAGLMLY
jgi:CNT family concentrative nucleoside transporter